MTEEQQARIVQEQARYIAEHYGDEAADVANYGWAATHSAIATKVYGLGVRATVVLTTTMLDDDSFRHIVVPYDPPQGAVS